MGYYVSVLLDCIRVLNCLQCTCVVIVVVVGTFLFLQHTRVLLCTCTCLENRIAELQESQYHVIQDFNLHNSQRDSRGSIKKQDAHKNCFISPNVTGVLPTKCVHLLQ